MDYGEGCPHWPLCFDDPDCVPALWQINPDRDTDWLPAESEAK